MRLLPKRNSHRQPTISGENGMRARPPANLEGTYRHAFGNKLFPQFRSGGLVIQHWTEPSRLNAFFREMKEMFFSSGDGALTFRSEVVEKQPRR